MTDPNVRKLADALLVLLTDPEIRKGIDPNAYRQARQAVMDAVPGEYVPPMSERERAAWGERREAAGAALDVATATAVWTEEN